MPDLASVLSYRHAARVRLDPRTSLFSLVVVNVVCLSAGFSGTTLWSRIVVAVIPIALLISQKYSVASLPQPLPGLRHSSKLDCAQPASGYAWAALACAAATAVAVLTQTVGLDAIASLTPTGPLGWTASVALLVWGALANLLARFIPVVLMAWYVLATTRAGELMGALGRLRVPKVLVIPVAVVLRMVPVLASESSAIAQAARTRGLRVGLARPSAIINYRIVPLTLRTVDIGDELTQAALTRGLDARGRRTCVGRIGAGWADIVTLVWCAGAVALYVWGL